VPCGREVAATGLEQSTEIPEKDHHDNRRGTESGTIATDSAFADAVAAIMRLPLSDVEKADVVRRLLAEKAAR